MDAKSQLKVDVIAKLSEGRFTLDDASKLLNCSTRTIERYLNKYLKVGISFVVHGNKGRSPVNKISSKVKGKVQKLIKDKYFDLNLCHLSQKLEDNEGIIVKRESLRIWAHEIHHVKRAKRRRAKVRKKRDRMPSAGLMMQMDGSTHNWFGDEKSCLIAIIDDATSELHAEFFPAETTSGCLKIIKDVVSSKGIFKTLYVDRAGIFGGPKRCNFSQVQRACEELGIEIIFANSAQGKGRIERSFNTLQDRLIPELRLNDIQNMQDANRYLQQKFLPNYWNSNLTVEPESQNNEFVKINKSIKLDDICIQKEYRKIRNDHTFSYNNKFFLIESDIKKSIAKQKIEVRKNKDGQIEAFFANQRLDISEVKQDVKSSKYEPEIQKKLDAILLAAKLGNVTKAAKISGCSRETIYKNKRLLEKEGPLALKRTFKKNKHHANRTPLHVENLIVKYSLENPYLGQMSISKKIMHEYNLDISSTTVRAILLRENINTIALRLAKNKNSLEMKRAG